MRINNHSFIIIAALAALLATTFVSCEQDTVYAHYEHTPIAGWEKNDTLHYGPILIDRNGDFTEEIGLRVNGDFPFQSLCLVVQHHVYPSQTVITDTITCGIARPDGTVTGQGISYYQYRYALPTKSFAEGDSIVVDIYHCMKREILPGVADIGLRIDEGYALQKK